MPSRARLITLAEHSLRVIEASQAPSGAYVASPSFPVYRFAWLRDGAFIADAMSRVGRVESAEAFFGWCARVLQTRRGRVEALVARGERGEPVAPAEHLHTRYTLDGEESDAEWWNFQLDGYGAWLWALAAHRRRHGRGVDGVAAGASLSARYVGAFWQQPSYDWWEEHADRRHTSTLAAIGAGLRGVAGLDGVEPAVRERVADVAEAVVARLLEEGSRLGYLPKWLGGTDVDASLLACAAPFGLLAPDDPVFSATLARIESELVHDGGVHRYRGDTYYGGGEWLLLAGLLGLQYAALGRRDDAVRQLQWMAAHATPDGLLPEQVDDHLLEPAARGAWLDRWGPVATPLVWSHAMYLSLAAELGLIGPAAAASAGSPA